MLSPDDVVASPSPARWVTGQGRATLFAEPNMEPSPMGPSQVTAYGACRVPQGAGFRSLVTESMSSWQAELRVRP